MSWKQRSTPARVERCSSNLDSLDMRFTLVLLLQLVLGIGYAQTPELDSLRLEMVQAKDDTSRINKGLELVLELRRAGDTTYLGIIGELVHLSREAERYDLLSRCLLEQGEFHHLRGDLDSASACFDRSEALCITHGLQEQLGYSLFFQAGIERYQGHHQAALDKYQEGFLVFQRLDMKPQMATMIFSQGTMLDHLGRFEESINKFYEALELFEALGDDYGIANCRNSLGIMTEHTRNHPKAMEHYRIGYSYAERAGVPTQQGLILDNIGSLHRLNGDLDSAMHYGERALVLRRSIGDTYGVGRSLLNTAWDHRANKDLASAERDLYEAIDIFTEIRDDHSLCNALNRMATVKQEQGDDQAAIDLAKEALEVAERSGSKTEEQHIQRNLSHIHENAGQYQAALEHYKIYHGIKDSILNESSLANLNELETRYETAKKDQQLAEQDLKIAQGELEVRKRGLWIGLVAGLGLITALVLIGQMRSIKQKRKLEQARLEQLEAEKKIGYAAAMINGQEAERSRIAKDLHDGLGALLATAKMHLVQVQQSVEALEGMKLHEKTGELLDNAYSEVRRIAHDMMPGSLEKFGLVKALRSLCGSLTKDGLAATLEVSGMDERLPEQVEVTLYRIAQEAANNMLKYAEASQFNMALKKTAAHVDMVITDNGKGFDPDAPDGPGLGLTNIRSRAGFIGGRASIASAPGRGTTITIHIPLHHG